MPLAASTLLREWETSTPTREQTTLHQQQRQHMKANQPQHWGSLNLSPTLQLPKHSATKPTLMSSMEVTLGRASMVAAFVLLANELATGQSLSDQLTAVVTTCLSP